MEKFRVDDREEGDFSKIPQAQAQAQAPPPPYPGFNYQDVTTIQPHGAIVVAQPRSVESRPSSCMWLSAIACCFCWPMALCAIHYSQESSAAANSGDYETARARGRTAMWIALGAIFLGTVIVVSVTTWRVLALQALERDLQTSNYYYYK